MPTTHSDVEIIGNGEYEYEEGVVASGATVYPGMIVEVTGENSDYEETPQVQPVSSVEKIGENFRVALTPDTPPKGNDTDIPRNHEYTAGESIQYAVVQDGAIVQNALVADGTGLATASDATIAYDDALGTNDDGSLQLTTAAGSILCRAREAVDNSTGNGSEATGSLKRINIEVV